MIINQLQPERVGFTPITMYYIMQCDRMCQYILQWELSRKHTRKVMHACTTSLTNFPLGELTPLVEDSSTEGSSFAVLEMQSPSANADEQSPANDEQSPVNEEQSGQYAIIT